MSKALKLLLASKQMTKALKSNSTKSFLGVKYSTTKSTADHVKCIAKSETNGFGFSEEEEINEDK